MLENARGQLFLVLLTIVAGIVCTLLFKLPLGYDLKGGTQLRYEVPEDVLKEIAEKEKKPIDAMMKDAIAVISDRIDPAGTLDPSIAASGENGILIELPWFEDKQDLEDVKRRIGNLGKLEMRMVAYEDFYQDGVQFRLQLEKSKLEQWLAMPGNKERVLANPRAIRAYNEDPLGGPQPPGQLAWMPRLLRPDLRDPTGKTWDLSFTDPRMTSAQNPLDKATVKVFTDAEYNNRIIPDAYLQKPPAERVLLEFVAINMKEVAFTGEQLDPSSVGAGLAPDGTQGVNYQFGPGTSGAYADFSQQYKGKSCAIILNGEVRSAPTFQSRISGTGIITGGFTATEVEELVKVLKTGSLRVEPVIVSEESIGPTLGEAAIWRGVWSMVAGAVLVFGFMLWYYGVAGTIACVTLVLNVFLLWAAMMFMQATITLPGLGGLVLTMGMAVDANVLIYERIREELAKGKDMLRAVRAGFDRAMSAILDSNITTFLVGLVLYNVGVGPVRGFAVTLMVGIVTTVFTQFFVTRLLFHYAVEKKWLDNYKPRTLFGDLNVDFVKYIKGCVVASTVVIGAGLCYTLFVAPREITLGIDFTGGANMRMMLATPMADVAVRERIRGDAEVAKDYPNIQVNRVGDVAPDGTATQFNLRIKLNDAQRERIDQERKADRLARRELKEGQQPPPDYEPPYVTALRRVFADRLVRPAFSTPQLTPHANLQNQQYAMIDVYLEGKVDVAKAREQLAKGLSMPTVTPIGDATATTADALRLEWTTPTSTKAWEIPGIVKTEIKALKNVDDKPVTLSQPFPEANEIQGRLVDELRNKAIGALILAWGLIVLYLRVRFHEYKYGIAAVVALVHDVLVALIAVVLFNHLGIVHAEINLAMIACFLAIIGYSVNDTIVIFDRIRENAQENTRLGIDEPFRTTINRALNQTMSRTILTSGLTLLVVIAQFVVNWHSESDLESFSFAMIIGMLSGVYSTIYIAAPILIWLDKGDLSKPKLEVAPVDRIAEAEAAAAAAAAAEAAKTPS